MIVLLPVGVLRVPYQLASGRPYSYLEELVLAALLEEAKNLEQLCTLFSVHRRIVIEVLVTLMYAGWIALDTEKTEGGNLYCVTMAGRRALDATGREGRQLPAATTVRKSGMSVVLERTLGQVARNSEVSWQPRKQLDDIWDDAIILPKRHVRDSVGPAQLAPIIPRLPGEWIRDIGLPYPIRRGADYAVLYADMAQKEILGVPQVWRSPLTEFVFKYFEEQGLAITHSVVSLDAVRPLLANDTEEAEGRGVDLDGWEVSTEEIQFLVGREEHEGEFIKFLETVKSWCVIVSPLSTKGRSQLVEEAIRNAIGRGVKVAVLWSHERCEQGELESDPVRTMLKGWEDVAEERGRGGALLYNGSTLACHGCVVIGDVEGTVCAVVGNFAWLGKTTDGCFGISISCRTTSHGVIGSLAVGLVELMQGDPRTRDTAEELRLSSIGEKLRGRAVSERDKRSNVEEEALIERDQNERDIGKLLSEVSVTFGAQHYELGLRDFTNARSSIDLAVGKATWEGVVDLCRDLDRWAGDSVQEVSVGLVCEDQGGIDAKTGSLREELKKTSRVSVNERRVGGYYTIDASLVLLSSVNWAGVEGRELMGSVSEIGVRMKGEKLVEAFKKKVRGECALS